MREETPFLCIVRKLQHIRYFRNIRVFAHLASIFKFLIVCLYIHFPLLLSLRIIHTHSIYIQILTLKLDILFQTSIWLNFNHTMVFLLIFTR